MFAIENGEAYGIWGGLTERQRRAYAAANGIPYRANWLAPDDEPDPEGTAEIVDLRDRGLTYAAIGEVVGMSRDGVRDRYLKTGRSA